MRASIFAGWLLVACHHAGSSPTDGGAGACVGQPAECGQHCTTDADCGTLKCVAGSCAPSGSKGDDPNDNGCPRVDVSLQPLVPTVMLLIDQSSSMTEDFHGMSRWDSTKNALTNPVSGVLPALASKIRFGATLYTSQNGGPTCPILTAVDAKLNNTDAITALIQNHSPVDDTPTGEALTKVSSDLQAFTPPPDETSVDGPRIIVVATDGEPDTCAVPDPQTEDAKTVAINAAKASHAAGIDVYILGVSSDVGAAHLQDMANAGVGAPAGTNAPYYQANTPSDMVAAFNTIIRGARSCTFNLNGTVDAASAMDGMVSMNGAALGFGDANGWALGAGGTTLELQGAACDTFKNSDVVTLSATFPCGSVIF